jgi:hypothetical protein
VEEGGGGGELVIDNDLLAVECAHSTSIHRVDGCRCWQAFRDRIADLARGGASKEYDSLLRPMPKEALGDAAAAQVAVARGQRQAGSGEGGAGHGQMRREQSSRARAARFSALSGVVDVNALD